MTILRVIISWNLRFSILTSNRLSLRPPGPGNSGTTQGTMFSADPGGPC